MEEKLSKEDQAQPVEKKKVYTPPTVTRYGKLTELTTGGTGSPENSMSMGKDMRT